MNLFTSSISHIKSLLCSNQKLVLYAKNQNIICAYVNCEHILSSCFSLTFPIYSHFDLIIINTNLYNIFDFSFMIFVSRFAFSILCIPIIFYVIITHKFPSRSSNEKIKWKKKKQRKKKNLSRYYNIFSSFVFDILKMTQEYLVDFPTIL